MALFCFHRTMEAIWFGSCIFQKVKICCIVLSFQPHIWTGKNNWNDCNLLFNFHKYMKQCMKISPIITFRISVYSKNRSLNPLWLNFSELLHYVEFEHNQCLKLLMIIRFSNRIVLYDSILKLMEEQSPDIYHLFILRLAQWSYSLLYLLSENSA